MKIYLDNCMFNRPFDEQAHIRIRLETEAKLAIQEEIRRGTYHLIGNIEQLVEQVKGKTYRTKLVLRKYIPKLGGKLRPLGIPAIADKLLQLAVAKILEAIYEQDFLGCSYGYRPNTEMAEGRHTADIPHPTQIKNNLNYMRVLCTLEAESLNLFS